MIIINVIKTNHVKCAMMPYKCLFIHSSLIFHNGNEAYRFIQKFFVSNNSTGKFTQNEANVRYETKCNISQVVLSLCLSFKTKSYKTYSNAVKFNKFIVQL